MRVADDQRLAPWRSAKLVTKRLSLRQPSVSDVETLATLRANQEVRRHLGGTVMPMQALSKARDIVGSDDHFVVETRSGEVAGLVSLTRRGEEMELSYEFFPSRWSQGFALEACSALLQRPRRPESTVVAVTQRANERSKRLLAALGFVPREEFEQFGAEQVLFVQTE